MARAHHVSLSRPPHAQWLRSPVSNITFRGTCASSGDCLSKSQPGITRFPLWHLRTFWSSQRYCQMHTHLTCTHTLHIPHTRAHGNPHSTCTHTSHTQRTSHTCTPHMHTHPTCTHPTCNTHTPHTHRPHTRNTHMHAHPTPHTYAHPIHATHPTYACTPHARTPHTCMHPPTPHTCACAHTSGKLELRPLLGMLTQDTRARRA